MACQANAFLSRTLVVAGLLAVPGIARGEEPAGPSAGIELAKAYGPGFPAMEDPPRADDGRPTLIVSQGFGCIVLGTTGTVAALGASSLNVVQHIAGGLVAPANPTVLALGLVGVVFASYCSIGAAVTPLYLQLTGNLPPAAEPAASQARTAPAPAVYRASLGTTAFRSGVLSGGLDSPPRNASAPRQR